MPTTAQIEREKTALVNRIEKRKARLAVNVPALKEKREKVAKSLNALATKVRDDEEGLREDEKLLKWYDTAPIDDEPTSDAAETSDDAAIGAESAEGEAAGTEVTEVKSAGN